MRVSTCVIGISLFCVSCVPVSRGSRRTTSTSEPAAFTSQCRGDFGATPAAAEFEAFMAATYELHQAAAQTQTELRETCAAMARELELTVATPGTGSDATRAVCAQVATALQTELAAIGEGTDVSVELHTQPPHCEARFDAYAECAANCDVNVQPGEVELACTGGEIRGTCSATCNGQCSVQVEAACAGTCEGWCEGTCSARAADGSCAGACDGVCHGSCVVDAEASCTGECRGGCSVEWQRPYCTGRYEPPQVNADCQAACSARVDASIECQPGQAELTVSGGPDAEALARIARVQAAVRVGIARIRVVHARAARLVESGQAVAQHLESLPEAIREVGLHAAACSAGAAADLHASVTSVTVTVEVSVSVSASLDAG